MRIEIGCILLFLGFQFAGAAAEVQTVQIDCARIDRKLTGSPLGININYLLDDDRNRNAVRSVEKAVSELGARFLRYPGGEKSDSFLWSVPPFDKPLPTVARVGASEWPSCDRTLMAADGKSYLTHPLDFDRFIEICRAAKAEPICVVCFDAMFKPAEAGGKAPSRDELFQTAVNWVRYANITCKHHVKYWELGNESYLGGDNGAPTSAEYAREFAAFAKAMKAIDPEILIGANGPGDLNAVGAADKKASRQTGWWETVLTQAGEHVDFLIVHDYPCWTWKTYGYYVEKHPDLGASLRAAHQVIAKFAPPAHKDRIRILITELNSADWLGFPENTGWKHQNTMGHALVLSDMFAGYLMDDRVDAALIWNTRWMKNATAPELWDTLDANNALLPTGHVLALWNGAIGREIYHSTGTQSVSVFASGEDGGSGLRVILANRDLVAHPTILKIAAPADFSSGTATCLAGDGADDLHPSMRALPFTRVDRGEWKLDCPAVSVVSIRFEKK